jgi:hypothetical protein
MDRAVAPAYDSAMKSGSTSHSPKGTSQAGSSSTPQRRVPLRTVRVVAAVILGLVVVAGFVHLVHGGDVGLEDAAPGREVSSQRAPSPTAQRPAARPALPQVKSAEPVQAKPAEAAPAQPRFVGVGAAEANRKLTQIKVQKYVHEAYPAWLQAHPGKECPKRLIELNEFMDDSDANDAWGRPLKMFCGDDLAAGAKGIEVLSLGRDAEEGTEDDIKARE